MWLLDDSTRLKFEAAISAGLVPTIEQQADYSARFFGDESSAGPRLLKIAGDVAQVSVSGIMTKSPDFFAMLFGGGNVTYPDIVKALAVADADPNVKRIEMNVDSPGGQFDGLFDALDAMQATRKPVKAVVSGVAASAAYALVSQAKEITASNRAARVGSIGVVGTFRTSENEVTITSTKAPRKRPDVKTLEGQAMVREELDALHDIFVDAIATGRGVSIESINATFGQGATLLADEALSRGMIDAIAGPALRVVDKPRSATAASGNKEERVMDLNQFKAEHPAVYAAAVAIGQNEERDRVTAHLIMGEKSGALDTAIGAVKDGSAMTATLQATYLTAGMNRSDVTARANDDAATAAATAAAATTTTTNTEADDIAASVESYFGVEANA